MYKLLIVDDEIHIRELLAKYASIEGYEYKLAENGYQAIQYSKEENFDLIIMDIMMPELDGFQAVKEIRKTSKIPTIMLSARSEEYDKLYGFELGIDDYVCKPFSPKELFMRVQAVLKRTNPIKEEIIKNEFVLNSLVIDYDAYIVKVDDKIIDLTNKEYELLVYLIKNKNNAVTRDNLIKNIWKENFTGDDRTLDTHIKSLRKKLGIYGDNIITIRRVGYRFDVVEN